MWTTSRPTRSASIAAHSPSQAGTAPSETGRSRRILDLFERMRAGEFPDGARVLRARIDMSSPNINLRDPVLYRILHADHPRTGDAWCIYPMYDFAHGQSDAIEGITHSLCSLEFEIHRPLYDWFIENLPVPASHVRSSSLGSTSPTPSSPSGSYCAWSMTVSCAAGYDSAHAHDRRDAQARASRPRACAISLPGSAWRRQTTSSSSASSSTLSGTF